MEDFIIKDVYKMDIKSILQKNKTIIVCDANVYLHIYSYSPDYSDYAIKCLNAVKDSLVMPSMVEIEYKKHQPACFKQMNGRINGAKSNFLKQISKAKNDSLSVSINLKKLGFKEIDELNDEIEQKYIEMVKVVEDFFTDRELTMNLITNGWGSNDCVLEIYNYIVSKGNVLKPFSQLELYRLCEDGKKRYSKLKPPGYKDDKKDGLSKYGDLIWWKEVLRYVKNNKCDLILVTDDVKEDWWEKLDDGSIALRNELIDEFAKTGQKIYPYTSQSFFDEVRASYYIDEPDMVQYALSLTDEAYCERISDKVFDKVINELTYNGMDYVDSENNHVGSLGIDEFDVEKYDFLEGEQANREEDDVYYVLTYWVKLSAYSFEYFGRDDETKDIILSPGAYHEFEGKIQIGLKRNADIFVDFENEDSFEEVEIVDGSLEETVYKPCFEEDDDEYSEGAYTTCPTCGKAINHLNDAGNGFCIECTQNED